MLSISFKFRPQDSLMQDSRGLSQAMSRGSPLREQANRKARIFSLDSPDGQQVGRTQPFKRLVLTQNLRQQLSFFRLFNEACGDLGMQPLSHLLPSKPFHPRIVAHKVCTENSKDTTESLAAFPPS